MGARAKLGERTSVSSSVGALLLAELVSLGIATMGDADLAFLLLKILSAATSLDAGGGSGLPSAESLSTSALLFWELDLGGSNGTLLLLDEA